MGKFGPTTMVRARKQPFWNSHHLWCRGRGRQFAPNGHVGPRLKGFGLNFIFEHATPMLETLHADLVRRFGTPRGLWQADCASRGTQTTSRTVRSIHHHRQQVGVAWAAVIGGDRGTKEDRMPSPGCDVEQ